MAQQEVWPKWIRVSATDVAAPNGLGGKIIGAVGWEGYGRYITLCQHLSQLPMATLEVKEPKQLNMPATRFHMTPKAFKAFLAELAAIDAIDPECFAVGRVFIPGIYEQQRAYLSRVETNTRNVRKRWSQGGSNSS